MHHTDEQLQQLVENLITTTVDAHVHGEVGKTVFTACESSTYLNENRHRIIMPVTEKLSEHGIRVKSFLVGKIELKLETQRIF